MESPSAYAARRCRGVLAARWPGAEFRVRSVARPPEVHVLWENGPAAAEVEEALRAFERIGRHRVDIRTANRRPRTAG